MTTENTEGLVAELAQLREERARLEAEAARLRLARDPDALMRRAITLASVVLPLAALAGYVAYRVFFRWFG
jgi:hypothetical protein